MLKIGHILETVFFKYAIQYSNDILRWVKLNLSTMGKIQDSHSLQAQ